MRLTVTDFDTGEEFPLETANGRLVVSLDDESKALLTRIAVAVEKNKYDGAGLKVKLL